MNSLFDYKSYKSYLRERFEKHASRGIRSRLAEAIPCHTAYISQVLNGDADFSLEQGDRINHFLGHPQNESQYFLLLLQYERAGTASLKAIFKSQMDSMTTAQLNLKNRLDFKKVLKKEDQITFYSSWHYGAIHVMVSVPGCNTARGISEYLGVPIKKVSEILRFLELTGLVVEQKGQYRIGTSHIHLDKDSPMISKHHTNWRLKAMLSLDQSRDEDLHYSSVITASRSDAVKIREIMVKTIEHIRSIVKDSKDEDVFCYEMDFFGLKK